jgi:hypothetical protein
MLSKYLWAPAIALIAVAFAALSVGNVAWADPPQRGTIPFGLFETIPVPPTGSNNTAGGLYSYDISWIDQATHRYYLADRSNKVVDIVDTTTNTLIFQLTGGFAGVSPPAFAAGTGGPNGVTASGHCLFVTDAPSRVVSFDTSSSPPTQISSVVTAAMDPNRTDELAFDPTHSLILAINNQDVPPFGTFIRVNQTTCALTQPAAPGLPIGPATDRILFNAANGVDATNGAEQPIWDPGTATFYLSIPRIGNILSHGGVVRIAPNATSVNPNPFPIGDIFGVNFCSPAGLTKGPSNDVLVGCNTVFDTAGNVWSPIGAVTAAPIQVILNVRTGEQVRVGGVGAGDEVWFNTEDQNYYTASSGSPLRPLDITPSPPVPTLTAQGAAVLGVIEAVHGQLLQLVPTFNVPAVIPPAPPPTLHPAGTAHSVAADGELGLVYVPLAANNVYPDCTTGCIAVYARGAPEQPIEVVFPPSP